ncbi:uncharacterized protein HKW66_Vig0108350 [Vigna angularis]|uniref:Uncharacterized protein n=1 Tax=Phaseolus angularis TaxID=3914 RepID=A0A8T0KW08_PHAAN|nr:uncharacterized protein HKW66_Vig0108350 [Vigna angularis]
MEGGKVAEKWINEVFRRFFIDEIKRRVADQREVGPASRQEAARSDSDVGMAAREQYASKLSWRKVARGEDSWTDSGGVICCSERRFRSAGRRTKLG